VLFAILLCIVRWRVLPEFSGAYLGGESGDAGLYVWLFTRSLRSLSLLNWFDTGAFYPYGLSLAWSDNFILPAFLGKGLQLIGLSTPAAYNLTLLLTQWLNGFLTFVLIYRLTGQLGVSLLGGLAFLLYAFFPANLGHPQLQFAFWIPLSLLCFFSYLHRQTFWKAFLLGLSIGAAFLCAVYYAVFISLLVVLAIFCVRFLKPKVLANKSLGQLIGGMLVGFSPVVPFILPYLNVRSVFGIRNLYEAYYFSAKAASYLAAPAANPIYSFSSGLSHAEAWFFPGLGILGLVFVGIQNLASVRRLRAPYLWFLCVFTGSLIFTQISGRFAQISTAALLWIGLILILFFFKKLCALESKLNFEIVTNRFLILFFLLCAFIFVCISFGPIGNPEKAGWALSPYRVFYEFFPGAHSIRAVSRAGILVIFCGILAGSIALSTKKPSPQKKMVVAFLALFILVENSFTAYPLEAHTSPPDLVRHLGTGSLSKDALVILPFTSETDDNRQVVSWGDYAAKNVLYLNWTKDLDLPILNGYSGQRSKLMLTLPGQTQDFPDERSLTALSRIAGLKHIIYVSKFVPNFDALAFGKHMAAHSKNLKLIATSEDGTYLMEYLPETWVTADYYLLVPPKENLIVHLELMAPNEKQTRDIPISILLNDAPIANARVRANGAWETHSFLLPSPRDYVRPFKLRFALAAGEQVFLKKRGFSDQRESLVH